MCICLCSSSCQFKWQQMITFALFCITDIVIVGLIRHSCLYFVSIQNNIFIDFFFLVVWVSISKVPFHRYGISIGVNICNQISIETFSLENSFDQHGNETIAPSPPKTFKIHSNKWICDYNKFRRIMINVTFTKVITRSQSSFSIYCSHVVIRHTITLWKLKRRKRTNEKKKTSNSLVKSFALCVTS